MNVCVVFLCMTVLTDLDASRVCMLSPIVLNDCGLATSLTRERVLSVPRYIAFRLPRSSGKCENSGP